jgi:lipopolysaccharide biosynthesis protein
VTTRETALFDAEWYLDVNPDVAAAHLHPLVHYLRWGANEGRAPHPLFDPRFYLTAHPEAAIGGGANALQHYLTKGWKKGYKPNPRFDPFFYLQMYPDIVEAGIEPLTHFITNGLREGRTACPDDVYVEPFEPDYEIPREPTPAPSIVETDVKAIAFYLPQFHPIPENDKWWGTGFTEWTNVRRGGPQFKDHYQPHVPSSLDYYDLRDANVLEQQVELARNYGIYGFCFYYYWFVGKILLDLPIRRMLERGQPDFPFCICWANENWTRRWDGQESEILIGQRHSPKDDLAFLKNIEPILLHKNYIRVDGKPLLLVYQPSLLPDAKATAARWREAFKTRGHGDIFLAATQTFAYRKAPEEYGFDAVIQFPPHANCPPITGLAKGLDKSFAGHIYDYNHTKWAFLDELYQLSPSRRIYPGVMPSWDNTARRRNKSNIWLNSSPESYYDWLSQITNFLRRTKPHDQKLVFINAWNEWAEGCHLEPDKLYGYGWLNATRQALLQPEVEAED